MEFDRPAKTLAREEFCHKLTRILSQQFPDEIVESMSIAPDLHHSLSSNFARGISRRGSLQWAVLGVPEGDPIGAVENSLTFALLWLDRARQLNRRGTLAGVRLILPKDQAQAVAYRCHALSSSVQIEIYELDPVREDVKRIDVASAVNLTAHIVPQREMQSLVDAVRGLLGPIIAHAPNAIRMHPSLPGREVWLRFHGLAFARWEDGEIFFGLKEPRKKLRPDTQTTFREMVTQLQVYRCPQASDTTHPLFRAQPERWLESIISEDVTRIDANLDPRFVYGQVFTRSGEQHGIFRPSYRYAWRAAGNSRTQDQRLYSPAAAGCGLLAADSATFGRRRIFAQRLLCANGAATNRTHRIFGCACTALPSHHRYSFPFADFADGSSTDRPYRKLAERNSCCVATVI